MWETVKRIKTFGLHLWVLPWRCSLWFEKDMTLQEKAVANLLEKGIDAFEDNDTVYVYVGDVPLEIAIYEQEYQAREYDEDFN